MPEPQLTAEGGVVHGSSAEGGITGAEGRELPGGGGSLEGRELPGGWGGGGGEGGVHGGFLQHNDT